MVSGPINCVKYLVFFFNLIFFLFGVALVGVGAYVQSQLTDYLNFFSTNINGPAILLIIVGLIIFVIAFFGCCGAIKENYCMVLTFSILMMIILVCQIGGAIAGFVYSNDIRELATKELKNSMKNYNNPDDEGVMKSWNIMQTKLSCCGVNGPDDWKDIAGYKEYPPKICCNETADEDSSDTSKNCQYLPAKSSSPLHEKACINFVEDLFKKNVYYVGAVGMALAVIQVTGIVLSCCLARAVRKEYEVA